MSFDFPGWRGRPPAIYAQPFAEYAQPSAEQEKFNMVPVMLEPTTEPVWPQDEEEENRQIKKDGGTVSDVANSSMAREILHQLRVDLPDRLFGYMMKQPPSRSVPTKKYDYYVISVSTTFSAVPGIIPRRLLLQLQLKDYYNKPPRVPIACDLYPGTEVATQLTNLGEFKIDLGAAIKSLKTFFPLVPDVLTAKTGGSIDIKKVQARVQAAGRNSNKPEWRIADAVINYDFNPACIVQVPKGAQLAIAANLHVEARKKLLGGLIYRTYFRTARPVLYILSRASGERIDSDKLPEGSKVTLRQPGVLYADEKSKHSYVFGSNRPDEPQTTVLNARLGEPTSDTNRPDEFQTTVLNAILGGPKPTSDTMADFTALSNHWQGPGSSSHWQLGSGLLGLPATSDWPTLSGNYVKVCPHSGYSFIGPNPELSATLWDKNPSAMMLAGIRRLVVEADSDTIGMIEYSEDTGRYYHHGRINIHLSSPRRDTNAWVEAISLVAQYMCKHLGHHRIISEPELNDNFAIACYRKVGFRSIGRMRQYRLGMDDRFHDALFMELLTEELTISTAD